jgi:CoA:oxalate CoA-transferase
VQSIAEVRRCEQLGHRGLFEAVDDPRAVHEDGTPLKLPRTPLLFNGERIDLGPVPRLGQHTDEILAGTALGQPASHA